MSKQQQLRDFVMSLPAKDPAILPGGLVPAHDDANLRRAAKAVGVRISTSLVNGEFHVRRAT